jgi:hypothetical protein
MLAINGSNWEFWFISSDSTFGIAVSTGTVQVGVWQQVVGVLSPSGGFARIYVNDVAGTDASYDGSAGTVITFYVAVANNVPAGSPFSGNGYGYFGGDVDELHYRNGSLTADWIKQEYNNQSSPSTFFSLGSQTGIAVSPSVGVAPSIVQALVEGTDIVATRGSATLTLATAPAPNQYLDILYYRLGAEFIRVENTSQVIARAAIEHGSGRYQVASSDSANTDWPSALAGAQQLLARYSVLPSILVIPTYVDGFSPGQTATLANTLPLIAAGQMNGMWIVQSVRAQYMPQQGSHPGVGSLLYLLTLTSSVVPTMIEYWGQMIAGTG